MQTPHAKTRLQPRSEKSPLLFAPEGGNGRCECGGKGRGVFFFKAEDRLPEGGLVEGPWQTVGGGRSGPAGRVEAVMAKRCEEGAARERGREIKIRCGITGDAGKHKFETGEQMRFKDRRRDSRVEP